MSYLIRRVLAKPHLILDEMCHLYRKFASYVRRVLFFLVKMALLPTQATTSFLYVCSQEGNSEKVYRQAVFAM